jgi:heme oxygenase (biliverdin-IX-beta and delta-forming)
MTPTGQVARVGVPLLRPDVRLDEAPPSSGRWPPLLIALRKSTRPDHARVAAFVSFGRRPGGWAEYKVFLAIHHGWIAALDQRLLDAARLYGLPFTGRLLPILDRDLFMAAVPYSATTAPANILPVRSRAEALGYLYVYEGFRLGCRVLARQVRRLGIELGSGGALLAGLGTGPREAWLRLVAALGRIPAAEHPVVIESATELFHRWEDWLRSPQARVAQLQAASGVSDGA